MRTIRYIEIQRFEIYPISLFSWGERCWEINALRRIRFLSDALKANVKTALNKRGGYREVYSRDGEGPILFEIKFRNDKIEGETQPLITYRLEIGFENGLPIITTEILSYRRGGYGRPYRFLDFHRGEERPLLMKMSILLPHHPLFRTVGNSKPSTLPTSWR